MEIEMAAQRDRPRVLIVGAGFAGLSVAKGLARSPFEVVLIDRQNYHLFQPLLYQVATAGLSPADIAAPIRGILAGQRNSRVLLASVDAIDPERREVVANNRRIGYDYLVIATGARHAYFGHDDWAPFAPGLKTVDDATRLRAKILLAFERAESEEDDAKKRRLLNFVVVGGGPTGVELAGAIAELAKRALAKDFRTIDPRCARIFLIESGPRLLGAFDPSLSQKAQKALNRLGVEVRVGQAVTQCHSRGARVGSEEIPTATIVWAAGVMASPAGSWLGVPTDRAGRVIVGPDFSVPGYPEIFVIGDTASATDRSGKPLPGVAPVAKQQGQFVASLLLARSRGQIERPFRYRDFGSLATIGRKLAVAQFGRLRVSGFLAWLLWSVAHIYFLIGFRNRTVVALTWLWNYLTFERGTRLITGHAEPDSKSRSESATDSVLLRWKPLDGPLRARDVR
jgi:NADH:ubiquinone reductase (H+-translocating)